MALQIVSEDKGRGVVVVAVRGSLDSDTYISLENKLVPIFDSDTNVLIIDLEGLTYISSMGLNVLFKARSEIEKCGGTFLMVNMQPQVKRVFEVVKALPDMGVFESMAEADRYLARLQKNDFKHD